MGAQHNKNPSRQKHVLFNLLAPLLLLSNCFRGCTCLACIYCLKLTASESDSNRTFIGLNLRSGQDTTIIGRSSLITLEAAESGTSQNDIDADYLTYAHCMFKAIELSEKGVAVKLYNVSGSMAFCGNYTAMKISHNYTQPAYTRAVERLLSPWVVYWATGIVCVYAVLISV